MEGGAGGGSGFIGVTLPWPTALGHDARAPGAVDSCRHPRGGTNLAPPDSRADR
jgi:hypothetical protein